MKIGDKVRILDSERKPRYEQLLYKIGKIARISTYIDPYNHVENTNYYVEIPEFINEYQGNGWWVFKDVGSLGLISDEVTCDDQMDAYTYSMLGTRYNITEIDDIIKGDNKMKILEIYAERKRKKTNEKYDKLQETIKLTDARYKLWKNCVDTLDELYKQDKIISNHFTMINLSEDTLKMLETNDNLRHDELKKLEEFVYEVQAQLSMCETYEQKQNVLNTYKILKANGKVNA